MLLDTGEHCPPLVRLHPGDLGLLVLEGLVLRRLEVMGRQGVELLGDGDVLRPWDGIEESPSLPSSASVKVCRPATVAVLDRDFHRTVVEYSEIVAALLERIAARSTSTIYSLALAQQPSLEGRLLCLLWHLSDRWGRVDRRGRVLDLPLQHQTLAEMVAARRPSVTSALRRLAERELVLPLGRSRGFRLLGAPPVEPDQDTAEVLAERPLIAR